MRKNKISKALLEVWQWKDRCYNEVKDLPIEEALKKRLEDSYETAKKLKFQFSPVSED